MTMPMYGTGWMAFMAQLALKATLLLLAAAVAAALLRRSSAAVRHMVWCIALAGVLALPVLALALPAWRVAMPRRHAAQAAAPVSFDAPAAVPPAPSAIGGGAARAPGVRGAVLPRAVAGVAGLGVLAGLVWLGMGFWGVARLGRRAERVRDGEWLAAAQDAAEALGLRRPVLLLRSRGATMPATWGLLWPAVIVPAGADGWPVELRRAVLAHELAHVKRFDCLTQALAQVACVLFWWHPAVWYAARRLRVERERACDDRVLCGGTPAPDYAAHLLQVARAYHAPRTGAPALVSMARPSHLESRLRWVLDGARARGVPSRAATLAALLAGVLVVVPLAAMRPAEGGGATWTATEKGGGRLQLLLRWGPSLWARQIAVEELRGVSDLEIASRGATPVAFRIQRESGVLQLEGSFRDYRGAGRFRFHPDRRFADTLAALGIQGAARINDEELMMLALGDVTAAGLRELRALDVGELRAGDLMLLAAFGVTPQYVRSMRALGLDGTDTANDLLELRRAGVTAQYVRELQALGYGGLTRRQLLMMRTQRVSPTFIRELRQAGHADLSPEALVRMKVRGAESGAR
jgi:beta-lactamase regulating signal transducer with metallopeptidase domain